MHAGTTPRDWENPLVTSRQRLRPHVPLRSFRNADDAKKYFDDLAFSALEDDWKKPGGSTDSYRDGVISLDGSDWKFQLFEKPDDVPDAFHSASFDDDTWKKVCIAG